MYCDHDEFKINIYTEIDESEIWVANCTNCDTPYQLRQYNKMCKATEITEEEPRIEQIQGDEKEEQ